MVSARIRVRTRGCESPTDRGPGPLQVNGRELQALVEARVAEANGGGARETATRVAVKEKQTVQVPPWQDKGKLRLVVLDAASSSEVGQIVFPLHKLAAAGSVQGWYHLKHFDSKTDVFGWNPVLALACFCCSAHSSAAGTCAEIWIWWNDACTHAWRACTHTWTRAAPAATRTDTRSF